MLPASWECARELQRHRHASMTHDTSEWLSFGRACCRARAPVRLAVTGLLRPEDYRQVRRLREWAGLYSPLQPGTGQVDNLFAFAAARLSSVAMDFEYALFDQARRAGLHALVMHIHESHRVARAWAEAAGWRGFGTITRHQPGWSGLFARSVYGHRDATARRAAEMGPAQQLARMRLPPDWSGGTPSAAAGS